MLTILQVANFISVVFNSFFLFLLSFFIFRKSPRLTLHLCTSFPFPHSSLSSLLWKSQPHHSSISESLSPFCQTQNPGKIRLDLVPKDGGFVGNDWNGMVWIWVLILRWEKEWDGYIFSSIQNLLAVNMKSTVWTIWSESGGDSKVRCVWWWVCCSGGGGDFRGGLPAAMASKAMELWDGRLGMEIWGLFGYQNSEICLNWVWQLIRMSWNWCGFLIICQFISDPFGHIVGIAYLAIAADMLVVYIIHSHYYFSIKMYLHSFIIMSLTFLW